MGYCQALFTDQRPLRNNTDRIIALLEHAGLPWSRSHELFYGHKRELSVSDFVTEAAAPLKTTGRVPILITNLDPAKDAVLLTEVFQANAQVIPGETILVRIVLSDETSFDALDALIRRLVDTARRSRIMPCWWPLVQVSGSPEAWRELRTKLGPLWRYINIAVNPFVSSHVWDAVADQVSVAQIVVPHADDIHDDGLIRLTEGMRIFGASSGSSYNLLALIENIGNLSSWPACIFLGPALGTWTEEQNIKRVSKAVRLFTSEVEARWQKDGLMRYSALLTMVA